MTIEEQLRARVGKDTLVSYMADGKEQGWGGPIIEVGRQDGRLYADVDYGYRFYLDEDITDFVIEEPEHPQAIGEWCRETHPHLFEGKQ